MLSSSYEVAIALYPVENLFSYFHDEIVFNNYIQTMVEVYRELDEQVRETDFALSLDILPSLTEGDSRYRLNLSQRR